MNKAADAFRTISEVAGDLDVPKHVLRFWEARFPQIKPMKRGGGRRYYRPADLDLLRGIRHLLHNEGYTIKGVQKILREQGLDAVKSCWQPGRKLDSPGPRVTAASKVAEARGKRRGKVGASAPLDRNALLARIVVELMSCRVLLAGEGTAAVVAAPARKRARG